MNKRNYQKELEQVIKEELQLENPKRLLLHSCCAPCSSYCLEYLTQFFSVTVFYYNPNIDILQEYQKRVLEQKRLVECLPVKYPVSFLEGTYEPEKFHEMAKGLEKEKEGGARCFQCYEMRLYETACAAKEGGYDYFTTTLSISPLKNAEKLNEIGERIAGEMGLKFLPSDFKKKNGYLRSIELSREYDLYRQNYCGCSYSKND